MEELYAVPLAYDKRPEVCKRQIDVRRFQSEKPRDVRHIWHTLSNNDVREQRRRQVDIFDLRENVPVKCVKLREGRRAPGRSQAADDPAAVKASEESAELRQLRAEVRELRRANEILKAAAGFFAAELDRPKRNW